jgi:hypothetical protein
MMELPILHILIFIAMTLCPEKIGTISIKGPDVSITLVREDGKWKATEDGSLWSRKGTKVAGNLKGKPKTRDVGRFVGDAITKFDWNDRNSYINDLLSIRKTDEGFKVTFDPNGGKGRSYLIAFKGGEQEPARHSVAAMPPSVVSTIPQCGDTAVDPGLKEIRVTFSKDMMTEKQWSVCQISDETFPKLDGDIRYLGDKRTCVVPVKLEPGKTYVLWFNMGKWTNFRDTGKNSSIPYLLVFETRDASIPTSK